MINVALKQIRLFHKMKQNELADKLQISKSYLSEIENSKKAPNLELLKNYSEVFDIPVSSLLFFSEKLEQDTKTSKSFRIKSASLVLKILEWSNKNADQQEKEAKNL